MKVALKAAGALKARPGPGLNWAFVYHAELSAARPRPLTKPPQSFSSGEKKSL